MIFEMSPMPNNTMNTGRKAIFGKDTTDTETDFHLIKGADPSSDIPSESQA